LVRDRWVKSSCNRFIFIMIWTLTQKS
jgi:hypothetical protein